MSELLPLNDARAALDARFPAAVKATASVAAALFAAIEGLENLEGAVAAACAHSDTEEATVHDYLGALGALALLKQARERKR